MTKIGTLVTGANVVTTLKQNYVPQFLFYVAATQLTRLVVTVEGDGVICDIDADGLDAVSSIRRIGQITNGYYIPLADGLVPNKVTEISFTNSAAQTPDIYAHSFDRASMYVKTNRQIVLANSQVNIQDFAYLGIKAPTANDVINIEFKNGTVQKFNAEELKIWIASLSNVTAEYVIDNLSREIRAVNYVPDTERTFYKTAFTALTE